VICNEEDKDVELGWQQMRFYRHTIFWGRRHNVWKSFENVAWTTSKSGTNKR